MIEWFDIYSLTDPSQQEKIHVEGQKSSIQHICNIIEEEAERIHPSRIILFGISQGYAAGLYAPLASKYRLGGLVGLSGWLPFRRQLEQEAEIVAAETGGLCLAEWYNRTLGMAGLGRFDAQANMTVPAFPAIERMIRCWMLNWAIR